jgi:isopropylmalate/homocitrate/citramalate synthase
MYSYGGFHITGILKGEWYLWENIKAEALGCRREIFYGPTALERGKDRPIDLKVRQMGLQATAEELDEIFRLLKVKLDKKKQVTEKEMEDIVRKVIVRHKK